MSGQILFILSDVLSGSTLFGQLLGAHSQIVSVGEIHWLRAYALNDRRLYNPPHELLCACGKSFTECRFWQATAANVTRPLADLHIPLRFFGWTERGTRPPLYRRLLRRPLTFHPAVYRSRLVQRLYGGQRAAQDSMELYDAVFAHTNAKYVVDMSKNAFRFRSLYDRYPDRLRAIVLCRDYRAVIYSHMKRGIPLENSARSWALRVGQIETLLKGIPSDRLARIKYEDLCNQPALELQRMCRFLGLEFEDRMLSRPTKDLHDLGGNPSKFEPSRRKIRLDAEYLQALSASELERMRRLVGATANLWGYA